MQPTNDARQDHTMHQARLLRGLASGSQLIVMVALFVLWKQLGWPFKDALEACIVAGVIVYTIFLGAATLLLVLAKLQSPALLLSPATRLATACIYGVLRYVQKIGIIQSFFIILVLYIAAWVVVRRVERRARRRFGW